MMTCLMTLAVAASAPEPETWVDGEAERFVGALTGATIGALAPLAWIAPSHAQIVASTGGGFVALNPGPLVLASSLTPLLSTMGGMIGLALTGGTVSIGAALGGLMASLVGQFLFLLLAQLGQPSLAVGPGLYSFGAALVATGVATSLFARDARLRTDPTLEVPANRFGLSVLAMTVSLAVGAALVGLSVATGNPIVAYGSMLVLGTTVWLPSAFVHRALGGHGSFGLAFLSWLGAAAIGSVSVAAAVALGSGISFFSRPFGLEFPSLVSTPLILTALLATVGVPLVLEANHAATEPDRRKKAITAGVAPLKDGAVVSLGLAF